MVDKSALAALFCILPAACLSGDSAAPGPSPREAVGELGDALDRDGIRWVAAGSRGYSLNVDSRDLPRGREIVEEVAERYGLAVLGTRSERD